MYSVEVLDVYWEHTPQDDQPFSNGSREACRRAKGSMRGYKKRKGMR